MGQHRHYSNDESSNKRPRSLPLANNVGSSSPNTCNLSYGGICVVRSPLKKNETAPNRLLSTPSNFDLAVDSSTLTAANEGHGKIASEIETAEVLESIEDVSDTPPANLVCKTRPEKDNERDLITPPPMPSVADLPSPLTPRKKSLSNNSHSRKDSKLTNVCISSANRISLTMAIAQMMNAAQKNSPINNIGTVHER